MRADLDWLFPSSWFGEDRTLNSALGEDVVGLLFSGQTPAFMPGDDLICAGWDASEFKTTALIGDSVIRMRDDHHLGVHPDVAAVAAKVDQAGGWHGARADSIRKRKWQIVGSSSIHVDGV